MESISRHRYAFIKVSSNRKLGPIPATTISRYSCPDECSYKGGGCYAAAGGPMALQWRKLDDPSAGLTIEQTCDHISSLRRATLWRHAQAGDLPKADDGLIDVRSLRMLAEASSHTDGFTFSHFDPFEFRNHDIIREVNRGTGLTINLSSETLAEVDAYMDLGIGPVVTALPIDQVKALKTPNGRHVAICPATISESVQCKDCGLCQSKDRKAVIGFRAHGASKKKVERIFFHKHIPT